MMKRFIFAFSLGACLISSQAKAETDHIQCSEVDHTLVCSLQIDAFVQNARGLLTNGWENSLSIGIELLDDSEKILAQSALTATQRCYLDPFESPCLMLWGGASRYQRYRDDAVFLRALSKFGVQAMTLSNLPAGNYRVRVTILIEPSAKKRLQSIQDWFKTTSSDSGNGIWSTNTLIGVVLSDKARDIKRDVYQTTLETSQFYIDLDFTPTPPTENPEPSPENSPTY